MGGQGARPVPRPGEAAHQVARGALAQRVGRHAAPAPLERFPRLAGGVGARRQVAEQRDDLGAVLVAQPVRPLLVEAREQVAVGEPHGLFEAPVGHQGAELDQVNAHEAGVGREPQALALAHQPVVGRRPERAAQRPRRLAQALARALLEGVGAQAPGERAARMQPGVHGEPRQQRAHPRRGRQLHRRPVGARLEAAEHPDLQHAA